MKLKKTLWILISTAFVVGLAAGFAGYFFGLSGMARQEADLFDGLADAWAPIYSAEDIQSIRNSARDLRNLAIEVHDYGMYCLIGAIVVGSIGAGEILWGFYKEKERLPQSTTSSG